MTQGKQEATPLHHARTPPIPDAFGRTAAAVAASDGNVQAFKALLDKGADVTTPDITGNSPAHYLAARGLFTALRAMREAGHGPHLDTASNFHGKTPQAIADAHFKSVAPSHEVPGTPFPPGLKHFQQMQQDLHPGANRPTVGPKPATGGPSP